MTRRKTDNKKKQQLPDVDTYAKEFSLTSPELIEIRLQDFKGKKILLFTVPRLMHPKICAVLSRLEAMFTSTPDLFLLCVSKDLPYTQQQFMKQTHFKKVLLFSVLRHAEFADNYGLSITEGEYQGLLKAAVICINEHGVISYRQELDLESLEPQFENLLEIFNVETTY